MKVRVNEQPVDTGAWPTPALAAVHELLRQRATELGFLADEADEAATTAAIEELLASEVQVPVPSAEECRRHYAAHSERYRHGEAVRARHILFQVTPGSPVGAIAAVAGAMLQELRQRPELFAERAREKSNCPSGAKGGELGRIVRGMTVPEFERAVFTGTALGVLPELVRSRHGFHIVAVDEREPGTLASFEEVAERVARELANASEQRALDQYVKVLAGQARIEGVELQAAASPLVQ